MLVVKERKSHYTVQAFGRFLTGYVDKDPIIFTHIKELTDKATTIIGYTPSPPFYTVSRFSIFSYIAYAMHLDIRYVWIQFGTEVVLA